jgi:hypothetical protein
MCKRTSCGGHDGKAALAWFVRSLREPYGRGDYAAARLRKTTCQCPSDAPARKFRSWWRNSLSSGMRRSEFCRGRVLSFSTLDRHLRKRRWKRMRRPVSSAGRWVPVESERSESSAGPYVIAMLYAASRSGKQSGGCRSILSTAGFTLTWNDARSRASFGPITLVNLSTVVLKSLACISCNSTVIVMSNNPPSHS